MRGAPLPNPFFRPEEKHVASGENNVVPPLGRRNKAMKKPAARRRTFQGNLQRERFTGLLATRMNPTRGNAARRRRRLPQQPQRKTSLTRLPQFPPRAER